ncbi:hypothetical protein DFS34DRAFT_197909 [Phlyctochytrium arcticum]|nr:hypothetical protein DFS34DRAFT_197909 [Phlyctochytrium arcticum]
MRFTEADALTSPVRVAALALSFLQSQSHSLLLPISSPFIHKRHQLLGGSHHDQDWTTHFQWQKDCAAELVERWDPARDMHTDHVFYKVLDAETVQACVPFYHGGATSRDGCVILLQTTGGRWLYHNLMELPQGISTFCKDWSPTLEEALLKASSSAGQTMPGLSADMGEEEQTYWRLYDKAMDSKVNDLILCLFWMFWMGWKVLIISN